MHGLSSIKKINDEHVRRARQTRFDSVLETAKALEVADPYAAAQKVLGIKPEYQALVAFLRGDDDGWQNEEGPASRAVLRIA